MSKYATIMNGLGYYHVFKQDASRLESGIRGLERMTGRPLPDDYRDFLRSFGGCAFEEYVVFPVSAACPAGNRQLVGVFFGFAPVEYEEYDILKNREGFEMLSETAPRLLPIGADPGGNRICLSIAEPDEGCVYYWDHEERAPAERVCFSADSFEQFMRSLRKLRDE